MTFYLLYISGISLLALFGSYFGNRIVFYNPKKEKKVEILWLVMIVSAIVVLGLRDIVTGDFEAYSSGFSMIAYGETQNLYYSYNVLYMAIVRFAVLIGGNIHTVFFICACISIIFLALGLSKIDCNKYLFFLLYLLTFQFFDQFNIVRQGTAMSICFFAINAYLIKDKNFVKYLIFTIIASLFHLSAIVILPIFFIARKKIPFLIMVVLIVFIYLLSGPLAKLPLIEQIFGNLWVEEYTKDFDYALITLSEVFIAVFILAVRKKIALSEEDNIILNLLFFFPLFRMGAGHFFILHRLSKYFINYYIISLLMIPRIFEKKSRILAYSVIFAFYFLWFYFYIKDYISFHDYKIINFLDLFRS